MFRSFTTRLAETVAVLRTVARRTSLVLALAVAGCSFVPATPLAIEADEVVTLPQRASVRAILPNSLASPDVTFSWSVDPPEPATILEPAAASTFIAFSTPGRYTIHLRVEGGGDDLRTSANLDVLDAGRFPIASLVQVDHVPTGFDVDGRPRVIASTDPAGISYDPSSGALLIVDSEIDELAPVFTDVDANLFELHLDLSDTGRTWNLADVGDDEEPNDEPTGIARCPNDEHVYIVNDDSDRLYRYRASETAYLAVQSVSTRPATGDPEGLTCDPASGRLFVVSGHEPKVLEYAHERGFVLRRVLDLASTAGDPAGVPSDPEGIAFDPDDRRLLLLSGADDALFVFDLDGRFVRRHDLSALDPKPIALQGITFGPRSSGAAGRSLYLVDGGLDNDGHPDERDGAVYELEVVRGS